MQNIIFIIKEISELFDIFPKLQQVTGSSLTETSKKKCSAAGKRYKYLTENDLIYFTKQKAGSIYLYARKKM